MKWMLTAIVLTSIAWGWLFFRHHSTEKNLLGLKWDTREESVEINDGASNAEASFSGTYEGSSPSFVRAIPSCGCMSIELPTTPVVPGQLVTIKVLIPGGFRGYEYKEFVMVSTNRSTDKLTIDLKVRRVAEINKRVFLWHVSRPATKQTSTVRMFDSRYVPQLISYAQGFKVELTKNLNSNNVYSIGVTPDSTFAPKLAQMHVTFSKGDQASAKVTPVYALIIQ
jgi:hypothetical protein